jgi:hypothetical protein
MEKSTETSASKEQEAFSTLLLYIKKEGINPATYLHANEKTIKRIYAGKEKPSFFLVRRLRASFSKVNWGELKKGSITLSLDDDLGFQQKTAKLRFLDKFLKDKAKLTFARALSLSLHRWNNLESGYSLPSKHLLKKTAAYFCLPPDMLLDDGEKLPKQEELKVDEDLAAIQRNDLSETMNYYKNKHYISRNYRVLSHPMRVKMYVSLLFILIPLLAYTAYSAYTIIEDRQSSIKKMADNSIDSTSASFQKNYIDTHSKATDASLTYCPVKIGAQVLKVYDIKPANEYFSVAMHVWFDFSQDDFHSMYKNYKDPSRNAEADNATDSQKLQDVFTVNHSTNAVTYANDGIPDYIELLSPFSLKSKIDSSSADTVYKKDEVITNNPSLAVVPELWKNERLSYPGLHESTIYNSYSRNFDIGKGVDNDSLSYYYAPGEPYFLGSDSSHPTNFRFFQNLVFSAKVGKSYDNPRYPLETAQFWMNITPTSWLHVNNVRYETGNGIVDVSSSQKSGTSYSYCSIDEGVFSAMSNDVAFTDGFRSIHESSSIKSHNEVIEYDVDETNPEYSYSKYTIVVRANRAAFTSGNFLPSTFIQSYINLFAVIIWIIIAFYNQSYAGEDSLGMLGTGMFSAISATIVGLQTLSDASMFSLLTMINIFTLAVILIMTYQAIASKRAKAKNDKALIAYNGVKLRVLFYILTLCTLVMFIGLPLASYIWTL